MLSSRITFTLEIARWDPEIEFSEEKHRLWPLKPWNWIDLLLVNMELPLCGWLLLHFSLYCLSKRIVSARFLNQDFLRTLVGGHSSWPQVQADTSKYSQFEDEKQWWCDVEQRPHNEDSCPRSPHQRVGRPENGALSSELPCHVFYKSKWVMKCMAFTIHSFKALFFNDILVGRDGLRISGNTWR